MQTYLEKRQPAKNMARFYRMAVLPNLFGEWTLYREWGRIGQVRTAWFADEIVGEQQEQFLARWREIHG